MSDAENVDIDAGGADVLLFLPEGEVGEEGEEGVETLFVVIAAGGECVVLVGSPVGCSTARDFFVVVSSEMLFS